MRSTTPVPGVETQHMVPADVVGSISGSFRVTECCARMSRVKVLYRMNALAQASCIFTCVQNSVSVATHAILERVFFHNVAGVWVQPYQPTFHFVCGTLMNFRRRFARRTYVAAPVPVEEFPLRYTCRRRAIYEQAAKTLKSRGLLRKDAVVSTFIKAEKLPVMPTKRLTPRVISPRSPVFNVAVGRYLSHLEHRIYNIVDELFRGRTITKGMNAVEVGELFGKYWSEFEHPIGVGLDASRFDQHISPALLRWEHLCYLDFYRGDDRHELSSLLQQQINNECYCRSDDGVIHYTTSGTRCSGDMNTALGNCLIMCAMVHTFMGQRRYRLLNNGDDCVLIMEKGSSLTGLEGWFNNMGIVMKVEKEVDVLEEVEFCQSHPVFDGVRWRMVRNFPASISKDAYTVKPIDDPRVWPRYLRSIGDCGMALTDGLPILPEYYDAMRRAAGNAVPLTDPSMESGMERLSRGIAVPCGAPAPVSDDARVSFCRAFGVLPELQLLMENHYRSIDLSYAVGDQVWPGQMQW